MENVRDTLRKVLVPLNHFVHRIILIIAQISMLAMVAIVFLTVVLRYCFNTGLSWAEEVPRLLVTVFAFIACAIGVRDHMHVAVNAVYNLFPVNGKGRHVICGHAAVRPVHAVCRRRPRDQALQPAGRDAHHRHQHRMAVSAHPGGRLCDGV